MSKPITLDSLDRDELLMLAHTGFWSQRDLVSARHRVASRRYLTALDESHAAWDRWFAASDSRRKAFEAHDDRAIIKAMEGELAAEAARDRAEAKVRRLDALRDRLWKLCEELSQ